MQPRTNFKGWQSDIDYEANEAERVKRVEQAIAEYKRMQQRMTLKGEIRQLTNKKRLEIIISVWLLGIGFVLAVVYALFGRIGK